MRRFVLNLQVLFVGLRLTGFIRWRWAFVCIPFMVYCLIMACILAMRMVAENPIDEIGGNL